MTSVELPRYLTRLPYHLSRAGEVGKLRSLLFSFDWLLRQVSISNLEGAISDCDLLLESPAAHVLNRALQLSRDPLESDPRQLPFQLLGRLANVSLEDISLLLRQASEAKPAHPWVRPLRPSLRGPDDCVLWVIRASSGPIDALASLGPRGFACAAEGVVQLWSQDLIRSKTTLQDSSSQVRCLAAVDESRLLTGSEDGSIRLWDLESGSVAKTYRQHTSPICVLAGFGESFVSAVADGPLSCWDLGSASPRLALEGHEKSVRDAAYLDDGHLATVADDRSLRIWNLRSGRQTHIAMLPKFPGVRVACWKPKHVIVGTFAGEVHIWKIKKRSIQRTRSFHYSAVGLNSWALLNRTLGVSCLGGSGGIRTWNPESGELGAAIHVQGEEAVAICRSGADQFVFGTKGGYVSMLRPSAEVGSSSAQASISPVFSIAVSDDGHVVSTSGGGQILVWDGPSGVLQRVLRGGSALVSCACALHQGHVASVEMHSSCVDVWNFDSGERVRRIDTGSKVGVIHAISRSLLVVAPALNGEKRSIELWDAESAKLVVDLGEMPRMCAVMISYDERFLVIGTFEGTILHFDLSTYADRRNFFLDGHERGVVSLAMLPNGLLASGGLDHSIRLWDLENQSCLAVLHGHQDEVTGIAPLAGGLLASASQDQTVRLWDLESRSQILRVDFDAGLRCLAALPDARTLVAGDKRGEVHFLRFENVVVQHQ